MKSSNLVKLMIVLDRHMAFREVVRSRVLDSLCNKPDCEVVLVTNEACQTQKGDLPKVANIRSYVIPLELPKTLRGRLAYVLDQILHFFTKDLGVVLFPDSSLAQIRFSRLRSRSNSILFRMAPFYFLKWIGLRNHHLALLGQCWGRYPELARLLDDERPDVIIYSNMILGQMDCLREARRRQIPLILDVPTWDQPTSKGPMTIRPDHAIAWSQEMKGDLVRLHNLKHDNVFVGGVLYFDSYFDRPPIESREDFFKRLGIDPEKKVINYCLSRAGSAPAAIAFIDRIYSIIRDGRLGYDCQLVVRANPLDNVKLVKQLAERKFVKLQLPKGRVNSKGASWLPDADEAEDRIAALLYSDVLLMIQSTMILDGCCMDRPIINLAYDAGEKVDEWQSVKRIFHFNHAQKYQELGSTWKVTSDDELELALKTYLSKPETHQKERRLLLEDLTSFFDGLTYQRWSNYVFDVACHYKSE